MPVDLDDIRDRTVKQAEQEQADKEYAEWLKIQEANEAKQSELERELKLQADEESKLKPYPVAKITSLQPLYALEMDSGAKYLMTPQQFAQFIASKAIPYNVDHQEEVIRGFKVEYKDRIFSKIVFDCVVE